MLSATEVRHTHRRRRSPYSDKQHYQEYILQRIEGYKNSIGRDELLRLGDEAASELQATSEGQFVLTEVLMLESVDRLIMKRLSLRPYRRWKQQFIRLRAAQRTPTHWGLEPHCPLTPLLPRLEPQDTALVIGTAAAPTTYLLAAHDAAVTFLAGELGCVERVESRMAAEALSSLFESYVTYFDPTLPEFLSFIEGLDIVVLDPGVLLELGSGSRTDLIVDLQCRSRPGGVHVILPTCAGIAPEALRPLYAGWAQEEPLKRRRRMTDPKSAHGLILCKPLCPQDTP
ncbi:MAG TPA: hypothetical protein VGJ36_09175 [Gemmatimonadales bacterium]|jgi:hypothetical protein